MSKIAGLPSLRVNKSLRLAENKELPVPGPQRFGHNFTVLYDQQNIAGTGTIFRRGGPRIGKNFGYLLISDKIKETIFTIIYEQIHPQQLNASFLCFIRTFHPQIKPFYR